MNCGCPVVSLETWLNISGLLFFFPVSLQVTLSPVNQSVTDGDPVNFTCHASGVPTPVVTWTFNGGRLPFCIHENNLKGDSFVESFLKIPRTTKEMAGTYKCTAKNKADRSSSSATLQVLGRFNDNKNLIVIMILTNA